MKNKLLQKFTTQFLPILGAIALTIAFLSAPAHAKAKSKRKAIAKISWEQCCEKTDGDSKKCQKMKNVKGKKKKQNKKWVAKSCPQPEPAAEEPMEDDDSDV